MHEGECEQNTLNGTSPKDAGVLFFLPPTSIVNGLPSGQPVPTFQRKSLPFKENKTSLPFLNRNLLR